MAELSPTAQAVWNAAWVNTPVQCGDIEGTRRAQFAAALRAAAYTIDWESGDPKFLLENVANELESQ